MSPIDPQGPKSFKTGLTNQQITIQGGVALSVICAEQEFWYYNNLQDCAIKQVRNLKPLHIFYHFFAT